jgi:peptide deformylase
MACAFVTAAASPLSNEGCHSLPGVYRLVTRTTILAVIN